MKARFFLIVSAMLQFVLSLHGQMGNTFYVSQFPGPDVGTKLTAAQQACVSSVPCILILDPSLAGFAQGTLPAKCSNCSWMDYRTNQATVSTTASVLSYAGATADAQINTCLAANDICDARGYGTSTQTIASLVEIGISGTHKILYVDDKTVFQPSAASVNMFQVDRNGVIFGNLFIQFPAGMTYSGRAFSVVDQIGYWSAWPSLFHYDSVHIDACRETGCGVSAGYGVYISPPAGTFIQSTNFGAIQVNGLAYPMYINVTGSGTWFNGNNFQNIQLTSANNVALTLNNVGTSGATIAGNTFTNFQTDGTGPGIVCSGSAAIIHNTWAPAYIWDTSTPISNTTGACSSNHFVGHMDGTVSDPKSTDGNWPNINVYELANQTPLKDFGLIYINGTRPAWTHAENSGTFGWNAAAAGELDYYQNVYGGASWWSHLFFVPNSTNTGWNRAGGFYQGGAFNLNYGLNLANSSTTLTRYAKYSATLSPATVAANTCAAQSVTVTGVQASDTVLKVTKPTEQAGLSVVSGRASAANTVSVNFCNNTSAPITPRASESYTFVVVQ